MLPSIRHLVGDVDRHSGKVPPDRTHQALHQRRPLDRGEGQREAHLSGEVDVEVIEANAQALFRARKKEH